MNIRVDLASVVEELQLTQAQSDDMGQFVVDKVTGLIFDSWRNVAGKNLGSTRNSYINGLQVVSEGRLKNAIVLFGDLNNKIELGSPPFDMKPGLLSGKRVKYTKDGSPFVTVPFRFATPGALGENAAFSGKLPSSVYTALAQVRRSGGDALTASRIPSPHGMRKTRPPIPKTRTTPEYAAYVHKHSIYAGLKREGDVGHRRYQTYRRVSLKSDKNSWIHKGFTAKNLAERAIAETDFDTAIDFYIDEYISTL